MIRSILAREDSVYKAFPDIAMTSDGTLVCTYRESLMHGPRPFSRVVVQLSGDGGLNWAKKQVIDVCEDCQQDGGFNSPRLLSLDDNQLLLGCDWLPPEGEHSAKAEILLWRSRDAGKTWSKKEKIGIRGRICLTIDKLKSGRIILGCDGWDELNQADFHEAYISSDSGFSWEGPIEVASWPKLSPNEGSYIQLDNGLIVCYLRTNPEAMCAHKVISRDDGKTWQGPYPTYIRGCHGRPKAGLLRSGEVAITYGFTKAPNQVMLHVEEQSTAAVPNLIKDIGEERFKVRRFSIDYDRSIHPDSGYSSWVQLASGDLFVVNYIVDDAPMAHIRSYRISRNDWILCPEGKLICHLNRSIGHHEAARKASEEQYRKVYS